LILIQGNIFEEIGNGNRYLSGSLYVCEAVLSEKEKPFILKTKNENSNFNTYHFHRIDSKC